MKILFPSLNSLRSEMRTFASSQFEGWRDLTEDRLDERLALLSILMWGLGSREKVLAKLKLGVRRVGLKMPGIEERLREFIQAFRNTPIHFIYCARNPVHVLRSLFRMPWVGQHSSQSEFADWVAERYAASLMAYELLKMDQVAVSDWRLDDFELTPLKRFFRARRLSAGLGLPFDPAFFLRRSRTGRSTFGRGKCLRNVQSDRASKR